MPRACCPSTNTETSSVTKQRLCDAHTEDIDPVSEERMPCGLPGEGTDKVEGSDKANIAESSQSVAMDTVFRIVLFPKL